MTGIVCCARAESGHELAAPSSVMNCRRGALGLQSGWSRFSVPDLFSEYRDAAPEHVAHRILNVCSPLALTFRVLSEFLLTNARRFSRLLPSVSKFSGV